MPAEKTRADALREFLSGASMDGGGQTDPQASFGNFRSSTEAISLGITIANAISNATILYAGGSNSPGVGTLTALDSQTLTWKPFGSSSPGDPSVIPSGSTGIVEASGSPGAYLRISSSGSFSVTSSQITLAILDGNQFSMEEVSDANASSGIVEYRASIVKNVSSFSVLNFNRWIATLGSSNSSDQAVLGASGSGTIATTGTFSDWPTSGWCQIRNISNTIREVVYYSSRSDTVLTVPNSGRALLGTSSSAGSTNDTIYPVPGVAIGVDPTGVQIMGSSIQTIASGTTAPTSVSWNLGIIEADGLQIGTIQPGEQVGIWVKRHIPNSCKSTPQALVKFFNNFSSF